MAVGRVGPPQPLAQLRQTRARVVAIGRAGLPYLRERARHLIGALRAQRRIARHRGEHDALELGRAIGTQRGRRLDLVLKDGDEQIGDALARRTANAR